MKTAFFHRCLALSFLAAGLWGVAGAPSQAQVTSPDEKPFTHNEVDPSRQGLGGGFDPMSLIHNANLGRSRNGADFADDSRRDLDRATDQFRQLQQQRFLEMEQRANPATAPDTTDLP